MTFSIKEFVQDLKSKVLGSVKDDIATKIAYQVDASIFEVEPLAVFQPLSKEDILFGIKTAKEHGVPIIPRGAATGITGGCLGKGLIIDCSKHLHHIKEINIKEQFALVETGVIQDDLNKALHKYGFRLGPETSTGNRATLGGMLANNAAGTESLRYGSMVDHILEVELMLAEGEPVLLKNSEFLKENRKDAFHRIFKKILSIRNDYKEAIETLYPKIPRISSGYRLDRLIKSQNSINLAELIAGSEGSLGVITELKLRIVKTTPHRGIILLEFSDLISALEKVPEILKYSPLSLELIDAPIIEAGRKSRYLKKSIPLLTHPEALFIVQFDSSNKQELFDKIEGMRGIFQSFCSNTPISTIYDAETIKAIQDTRKAGLGLLLSKRDFSRAVAFIEDLSVSPASLAPFMSDFLKMLTSYKKSAGIYGHAGAGCLHIRPYMDLRHQKERDLMVEIMQSTLHLILKYGGVLSGEHGDGLIRSSFNRLLFGEKLYEAFCKVKDAFDSAHLMNPGKVVGRKTPQEDLRHFPHTQKTVNTFLNFSQEGGFELSVDLCNGNGLCRKKEGVMCPSFQATGDEYDTTRARAEMLRAFLSNEKEIQLSSEVLDILDLCLMCKGCKRECPSQVDMAKMKVEVLYQASLERSRGLRDTLFGHLPSLFTALSFFSPVIPIFKNPFFEKKIKKWLHIALEREIPFPQEKRFSSLFKKHTPQKNRPFALLFNDTFNEFLHPSIGKKAVEILEHLGYSVIIPDYRCCGRTLISKGMLKEALKKSISLVKMLSPYAMNGIPIIGLEPSCILTLRDETIALIGKQRPELLTSAYTISKNTFTFDEFLSLELKKGKAEFHSLEQEILLHTHCHEMAEVGREPSLTLLKALNPFSLQVAPEGCCGMAGSFGYEEEHHDLSLKIANLKLFPAIQKAGEAVIIANGSSCRSQILFGQKKEAMHMAELFHQQLIT